MIVSDIDIEVLQKNIKRMRLYVLPTTGKVCIYVPFSANDNAIRLFIEKKIVWLKNQIEKFASQPRQSEREVDSDESLYLWGKLYYVEVRYSKPINTVEINDDKVILTVRGNCNIRQKRKIINDWYRDEIRAKLPALIEKWQDIFEIKINDVSVRNMLSHWATCDVINKKIRVNLHLAKKSVNCLEYVIVHQILNILEKNHSNLSVEYMDKFLPDWRLYKEELNNFTIDSYSEEDT